DGTTHTTGAAYVVSISDDYATFAPGEIRALAGRSGGAELQQQTAANLGATIGRSITVHGGRSVVVDGVVDLPYADSFFQVVGARPRGGGGAAADNGPAAPPARFARPPRGPAAPPPAPGGAGPPGPPRRSGAGGGRSDPPGQPLCRRGRR